MWGSLNIQILPHRIPQLVGDSMQGTAIGAIVFVGLAVAIIVQPVAGALSDRSRFRWGRRRPYMLAGLVATIPFLIIIGLSENYLLFFVAVIGLQIAANTAHGPYQGIIPDQVQPEARGRASGFFGFANLFGTILGVLVASIFLSQGMLWPAVIAIIVTLLATSAVCWMFVPETPPETIRPFDGILTEARHRLQELRLHPAFVWLVVSRLFFFMGLQAMDNFLQLFLGKGLGESEPELQTTAVLGVVILVAVIGSIPAGWAADRYGRLRLIAVACVLGLISALLMIFSQSFIQVLAFASILGLGLALFTVSDWALAIDLVPDENAPGLYMGITNLGQAGGDALATLSAGIALDVVNNLQPGLGYRASFGMMAIYFLASLLVLRTVRSHITDSFHTAKNIDKTTS
jgi:MFS family permease